MHTVELSNHPGDMLDNASRRRVAAEKRVLSVYEDELIRYRARVQTIKVKRDRARAKHRWWTWLRLAFAGWKEKRGVPRPPIPAAGHTDTEEKLMAGIAGEQQVAAELNESAGDLERFLRERGHPVTVQRVVILAHRRSRIGTARNLTVRVGTSAGYLLTLIDSPSGQEPLTGKQRSEIRRLIQHDHALHDKQRHDKQRHDKRRRAGPRPHR